MLAFNSVLKASLFAFTTCLALVGTGACSDDDKAAPEHDEGHDHLLDYCDLPASCRAIIDACHTKDDGTAGPVHDCHEVAHGEGDEGECTAKQAECVQTCNDAPDLGGEGPTDTESCVDGGSSDHDHDG